MHNTSFERTITANCLDKEFEAIRKKLKHTRDFSDADMKRILKHLDIIQDKYHELEKNQPEDEKEAANPKELYQRVDPRGNRNPLALLGNLGRQKLREALVEFNKSDRSVEALQVLELLDNLAQEEFVRADEFDVAKKSILEKARKLPEGFTNAISIALSTTRDNARENAAQVQSLLYKQQHGSDVGMMTPDIAQRREQDTQEQKRKWLEQQSKRLQEFITSHPSPEHAPAYKMASMLLERALKIL